MKIKFSFVRIVDDIALTCHCEYYAGRSTPHDEVELIDIEHNGGSIYSILSPQLIAAIEEEAYTQAQEDFACAQEDHWEALRDRDRMAA